ncbi:MAG TPA: hypothetical protein PLN26_10375 [Acidobacteriota bacterium]|nr:hypothetical protein [Acidobacteriota bacterium]HQG92635.1 hypothetical protein [Acidobacteriota bacterium]HQK88911.1 hypothetical protein [Acidobacteriota bacterium]
MRITLRSVAALLFAGLAPAVACPAGPTTDRIALAAPMVLEYTGQVAGLDAQSGTRTVFRIRAVAPEWRVEWEEAFRLGAFVVPARVLAESRRYYRSVVLENGRELPLDGTLLVLSAAVYDELEGGRQAKLQIQRYPSWLRQTGETTMTVDGRSVPALAATDSLGRTYCFQRDRAFPLLLRYQANAYTECLTRIHHGDVLFRWYH